MRVTPVRRVGVAAIAVAAFGGMLASAQQLSPFRTSVDLISLPVTVTSQAGRFVTDLSADDFEILEDGRPQDVAFFARTNPALLVSLLVDTSSSMQGRMALAQRAATQFVAKLRTSDVAEVVDFDSRVEILQPFTSDHALLADAIARLRPGGSTALYNAVYIGLREFEKIKTQPHDDGRDVIVVLSDGEDTSSLLTFDELIDQAKRSQTVIYSIGLGLEDPSSTTGNAAGEFALRRLAQETGGRLFTPKRPEDLSSVYGQIADELSNQYVIGYLSRNERRDGGWRSTTVRVKRPQVQARTRPGYYAAGQP